MERSSWPKLLIDAAQATAVIAAAVVAILGISAWRKEMAGRCRFALAEDVLRAFYEARDKIRDIRSAYEGVAEGSSRQKSPDESERQAKAFDRAFIKMERYKKERATFERLRALRYPFEAVFGSDAAKPFDEIERILQEILAAGDTLAGLWNHEIMDGDEDEPEKRKRNRDLTGEQLAVFWQGFKGGRIRFSLGSTRPSHGWRLSCARFDGEGLTLCRSTPPSKPRPPSTNL